MFAAREEARLVLLRLRGLRAQLVADELECRGDGLVHVVVLVAAQASGEDHVALLRRQLLVLLVEGLVLGVVDGVVGLVAGLPVGRVLARDDGLVLGAELEVLVLDDARGGDLALGIVDHGHALVVLLVERLGLKAQAAVLERAQLKVVERVDGAAVDRLGGDIGLGGDQLIGQMGLEVGYGLDGGVGYRLSSVILQGKIIFNNRVNLIRVRVIAWFCLEEVTSCIVLCLFLLESLVSPSIAQLLRGCLIVFKVTWMVLLLHWRRRNLNVGCQL